MCIHNDHSKTSAVCVLEYTVYSHLRSHLQRTSALTMAEQIQRNHIANPA